MRLLSMTAVDTGSGGGDGSKLMGPPRGRSARDESSEFENDDEKFHKYQGEVFCNRALNMRRVMAVGFDMDYTLAQYIPETFELLAHRGAMDKLVNFMMYPEEIRDLPDYDPNFFQRGLMIDKERGNIIKMDRHSYVKVAYHGTKLLDKAERAHMYGSATQKDFSASQFAPIDTLFSLPDAFMYSQLVTFIDENQNKYPQLKNKTYKQIYADVRRAVDLCHRDGVIKDMVGLDPGKYIQAEPGIIDMLKRYRASGRKVFLLTNSLWDYTNVVMNHMTGYSKESERNLKWLDLFDLVLVGACKPQFLENERLPLFRCHTQDGLGRISNMDNALFDPPSQTLDAGKVFQGGNYQHLHYLLGVQGEQIVYAGDHMFSDVIRGKRSLGWRTVLVIPELQSEIDVALRQSVRRKRIQELRELRDELDEWIDRLSLLLVSCERDENCALTDREVAIETEREKAVEELNAVKTAFADELRQYHESFHPVWGQMLKVGYQNSRFAQQVQQYACLYTSKVSNLGLVSPEMSFRTQLDLMPHDQLEETPIRRILRTRARHVYRALEEGSQEDYGRAR